MQHELKTVHPYFEDVRLGKKLFELRKNDRGFKTGDSLLLREYIPSGGYTGRGVIVRVQYILEGFSGLEPGYCIMGISVLDWRDDKQRAAQDNKVALTQAQERN